MLNEGPEHFMVESVPKLRCRAVVGWPADGHCHPCLVTSAGAAHHLQQVANLGRLGSRISQIAHHYVRGRQVHAHGERAGGDDHPAGT